MVVVVVGLRRELLDIIIEDLLALLARVSLSSLVVAARRVRRRMVVVVVGLLREPLDRRVRVGIGKVVVVRLRLVLLARARADAQRVVGFGASERRRARALGARGALAALAACLLYTSPSPRDGLLSRMPSSA